jgi:hypothetical protein
MFQLGVALPSLSAVVEQSGSHEKAITSWSEVMARSSSISHVASGPTLPVLKVKSMIDQQLFPRLVGW